MNLKLTSFNVQEFEEWVDLYALRLLDLRITKGDRVATMLLTTKEHYILMYACFKVGAIIAPIDVRLKETEVVRDLQKIKPRAVFSLVIRQYVIFHWSDGHLGRNVHT